VAGELEPVKQTCHTGKMPVDPSRRSKLEIIAGKQKGAHRQKPRRMDFNQVAQDLVRRSTKQDEPAEQPKATDAEISRVMAELGRRGGKLGGVARAAGMTPERRREIALKAARKRWDK
jgi:hypothetical protein